MDEIYDNMNGKTVQQLLIQFGDELRTDAMVLKSVPRLGLQFQISNPMDCPEIIVMLGDKEIRNERVSLENCNIVFEKIFSTWFGNGEYIELPYKLYLKKQEEEKINKSILDETTNFINKLSKRKGLLNADTKAAILQHLVSAFS